MDVDDADGKPALVGTSVDEVDKPVEHGRPGVGDVEVRQETEQRAGGSGYPRYAGLGALQEDARSTTDLCHGEECTASQEEVRIPCRPGRGQNNGVDDRVEACDAGVLGRNGPWRCSSTRSSAEEFLVVTGDDHTDRESSEDVEGHQAVEVSLASLGQIDPRRLHLSSRLHQKLGGKGEREDREGHGADKCTQAARGTTDQILVDSSRVLPVVKSEKLVVGPATKDQDESHDQESYDAEHFEGGEPEFRFTVHFDREAVEPDDDDHKDGDPDCHVDGWIPVLHDDTGRRDLGRHGDGEDIPIHPAQSET